MPPVAFVRRIRTLRMLASTALTAEQTAIYTARIELAWAHIRIAGRTSWKRAVEAHNAKHGLPAGTPYRAA